MLLGFAGRPEPIAPARLSSESTLQSQSAIALSKRLARIAVEQDVDLGGHVVGEIEELLSRDETGIRIDRGSLLHRQLDHIDRVVQRVDRTAQVQPADDDQAAPQAPAQQGRAHRQQGCDSKRGPALRGVVGPELDGELVLARVPIADHLARSRIEILLGILDALGKRRGCRPVQDADAAARALAHLDPVQAGTLVHPAGADAPDLAGRERVAVDMVLAAKLGGDDELLDPVPAQRVAELRVAELGRDDPLLLLLDPAPAFQGQPDGPFQILIGDRLVGRRVDQLQQSTDRLADGVLVPAAQGSAEVDPAMQRQTPACGCAGGSMHSLRKSLTRPKWSVLIASLIFGTSQPGR